MTLILFILSCSHGTTFPVMLHLSPSLVSIHAWSYTSDLSATTYMPNGGCILNYLAVAPILHHQWKTISHFFVSEAGILVIYQITKIFVLRREDDNPGLHLSVMVLNFQFSFLQMCELGTVMGLIWFLWLFSSSDSTPMPFFILI